MEGFRCVTLDSLDKLGRRDNSPSVAESQGESAYPAGVRGAQGDAEAAVGDLLDGLAGVVVRDPPALAGELEDDRVVVRSGLEQTLGQIPWLRLGRWRGRLVEDLHANDAV